MRRLRLVVVAAAVTFAACDFEESLDEYCRQTGRCPDAGAGGGGGATGGGGGATGGGGGATGGGGGDAGVDAGSDDGGLQPFGPIEDIRDIEFLFETVSEPVYAEDRRPFSLSCRMVDGGSCPATTRVWFPSGAVYGGSGTDGGRVHLGATGDSFALGAQLVDAGARLAYRLGPSSAALTWRAGDGGFHVGASVTRDFHGKVKATSNAPSLPYACTRLAVEVNGGLASTLGLLPAPRPLAITRADGGAFFVHANSSCQGPLVDGQDFQTSSTGEDVVVSFLSTEVDRLAVRVDSGYVTPVDELPIPLIPIRATLEIDGGSFLPGPVRLPDGGAVLPPGGCITANVAWRLTASGAIVDNANASIPFEMTGNQVSVGGTELGFCTAFFDFHRAVADGGLAVVTVYLQRPGNDAGSLTVSLPNGISPHTFVFP